MTEYQIQANTRRCAVTGRELKPGEKIYSVLREENGKFQRQEISSEAWSGQPDGTIAFWVSRVPAADASRRPQVDDELLFECFQRLAGQTAPDRVQFRWVVALLLLRRKRLKFEESRQENGQETLVLRCQRTRELHEVVDPRLSEEETAAVQEEVFKVLGWE